MAVYTTIEPVEKKQAMGLFEDNTIVLREEQEDAINAALKYFKKKSGHKFLWNAKMRFGKTLCALELARRMGRWDGENKVKRTLIVTHRPVVNQSWSEDFVKIFGEDCTSYKYGTKFEDDGFGDFYQLEKGVKQGCNYIFFASIQFLRRSTLVGGDNDEQLKKDILLNNWDLIVIDEAHEGTKTNLGQKVIDLLTENHSIKTLLLSGTPFNLFEDFTDDQIYTWDYIKEQTAKREWSRLNPNQPVANNPYRELPEMEIRTYNLGNLVKEDLGKNANFQFKEFFRTYQGQNIPEEKKGKFVHEDAVKQFLDLMCTEDKNSHYPFSTDEYRTYFNHTLWVVPGVKEAKALENLLAEHEIFGDFDAIINVAGNNEDDETRQDALDKVKKKIGDRPDQTYTITISCGRLTTGVTVRPWTAVFYLKGSENTSAATYMQTIFRVQSPYHFYDENHDLQMKTKCYVFDFAPDRSLKMVAETAKFATLTQKQKHYASAATSREKDIENMQGFLEFCPVISMEGGQMIHFEAERLFEQLEHVYVERVVRNGFNDNSLYDIRELMNLDPEEIKELDDIGIEIGKTTNMEKPKRAKNINITKNHLSQSQKDAAARAKKKQREGKELTEEEKKALEAERERKAEERKERDNRITILRGISLRIPLLMYGAEINDEEEGITLQNFTRIVDDDSWLEFMPRGVDKKTFNKFKKCYNATVFVAAGKRYRQLAREADNMHIHERVERISEIFSYFHNPDKETVLTPWRVVNMHLNDCFGGYTFYNERFDGPNEISVKSETNHLFDWIPTITPRYVNKGDRTATVFGDSNARILEINSKTGLYPLYVTYSLFRQRCKDFVQNHLIEDENNYSVEEEQVIWDDILSNNVYVICNTTMAKRITHRTLLGFRTLYKRNGTEQINIKSEKLIERTTNDFDGLINDLQSVGYWHNNKSRKEKMKFRAIVGNPPYQIMDGGAQASAKPIYQKFVELSRSINPTYISMIMPTRWYAGGKGLDDFRKSMLEDKSLCLIHDFLSPDSIFPGTNIRGGICYFLWDANYNNKINNVQVVTHEQDGSQRVNFRQMKYRSLDIFIRDANSISILEKVSALKEDTFENHISCLRPFGFRGFFIKDSRYKMTKEGLVEPIICFGKGMQIGYVERKEINVHKEWIDTYKVYISRANNIGTELNDDNLNGFIGLPKTICTESYLVVGMFLDLNEQRCERICKYFKTRFARFMHSIAKSSQDATSKTFRFVPVQDFNSNNSIDWDKSIQDIDNQLYNKYKLSDFEKDFINRKIKLMDKI